MKRLMTLSLALMSLALASDLAIAQRGGGRSGRPAGPPRMAERGQMQTRSNKPGKESSEPSSASRVRQTQPSMSVGGHLEKNAHLATRLQGMFPPGTDLQVASNGFKNLGQFVAATHVSKNLGIPFDQLKARMTGESSVSLGKAIKELRPEADASHEVKRAERQAKEQIKQSESERKLKPEDSK